MSKEETESFIHRPISLDNETLGMQRVSFVLLVHLDIDVLVLVFFIAFRIPLSATPVLDNRPSIYSS